MSLPSVRISLAVVRGLAQERRTVMRRVTPEQIILDEVA